MTPDAPTPPTSLAAEEQRAADLRAAELREAQFTRKLVLAVLSTLQHKGILKAAEVDALLLAARRAADASTVPTPVAASQALQTPAASAPLQPTAIRARTGLPIKVRAEPARPIALHTQPPAPVTAAPEAPSEGAVSVPSVLQEAVIQEAGPLVPSPLSQPAEADAPAAAPTDYVKSGEVKRLRKGGKEEKGDPAKAPPIFDIQID